MRDSGFDLELEMMKAAAYLQTLSDGPEKEKVADYLQELHQEQQQRLAESFDASKLETKSS